MKNLLRLEIMLLLCIALCVCIAPSAWTIEPENVLTLPASSQIIDTEAFCNSTSVNRVVLPNGIKEIRARAFANSSLTRINLPDSLTLIDETAFTNPENITVTIYRSSRFYDWAVEKGFVIDNGFAPLTDFTFESIDDTNCRIKKYIGVGGRVVIPDTDSDGRLVKEISPSAFEHCSGLTEVVLPSTLEKLGDRAFAYCTELTAVNIPASLNGLVYSGTIYGAFYKCTSLTSVTLEEGWVTIPKYLFADSGIRELHIPESVRNIDCRAFENCEALETITFPEGLENIGYECFRGCTSLKRADLPAGVRNLGGEFSSEGEWITSNGGVFRECTALEEVTLPQHLNYANNAFYGCTALKNVHFAEGTSVLPYCLFYNCGLEEVTLPESLRQIKDSVFWYCENLETVYLNDGLQEIGPSAFEHCGGLTEVVLPSTLEKLGDRAFAYCTELTAVNIPASLNGLVYSGTIYGAFYKCTSLTSVTLEEGWVTIPKYLFADSGIRELHIPESVRNIDCRAFENCEALETITFPEGLENIGYECFRGCTSLKRADLPAGVRNLGGEFSSEGEWITSNGGVFRECTALEEVTLPQHLNYVNNAFYGCTALKTAIMIYPSELSFKSLFGWSSDAYSFSSSNPEVTRVYINSGVVGTYGIGRTVISAIRNDVAEYEITVYVRSNYSDSGSRIASGILREGDGWVIRWMIAYDENAAGVKSNAQLYIYLSGVDSSGDSLMLFSTLGNGFLMPWLTEEYGFTKEAFNRISITGGYSNPFEIISDTFKDYVNVRQMELARVKSIQARAFEGCTSLVSVQFDPWLFSVWDAAFKDCTSLQQFRNKSYPTYLQNIGDEAFMNTGLTGFDFGGDLTSIGDRAFMNTMLGRTVIGRNVTSIGENAFADCENLVICCYPNSEALRYAMREAIEYALINTPEKTIVYGNYSTQFGPHELSIDSTAGLNNKNMAVLCAMLSDAAYGNTGFDLVKMYQDMFSETDADTVIDYEGDAFCSGIALGTVVIDGQETNVLVITVRGTHNPPAEIYADLSTSTTDMWGNKTYTEIINFQNRILTNLNQLLARHSDFSDKPLKIIITGHSLGGAAANLIAAMFTRNMSSGPNNMWASLTTQSGIYAYTFGAIDALSPNDNGNDRPVEMGYENIHNVFNIFDQTASSSDFIRGSGSFGEGKYGHMDFFAKNNGEFNINENHQMYRYLEAVATAWVGEQKM